MPIFVPLMIPGSPAAWGPPPPVAPKTMTPPPNIRVVVPMIFPVVGNATWNRGYGSVRQGYRHTGVDIRARKMSPIVAPFDGTLGLKRESFWIYGDNGYAILGTHLNDDNVGKKDGKGNRDLMFAPDLVPGQRVHAGQLIGYVGESGNATGPHLHFELHAVGVGLSWRRLRNPTPSLHMAQRIKAPKPVLVAGRPPAGSLRLQGCLRSLDEASSTMTMILASKQLPNGTTKAVSRPTYVKLRLDSEAVEAVGGYGAIGALSMSTPFGVTIPATGGYKNARVSEIVLPEEFVTTGGDGEATPLRPLRARSSKPAPALGRR